MSLWGKVTCQPLKALMLVGQLMLGSGGWQTAPTHSPPAGLVTRMGWEWFPHVLLGIPTVFVLSTLSIVGCSFFTQRRVKRIHNSMCGGWFSFVSLIVGPWIHFPDYAESLYLLPHFQLCKCAVASLLRRDHCFPTFVGCV